MPPTPIFILGISPRSGTNYLYELLTLHPECARSTHVGEDFLIQAMSDLVRFVTHTSRFWNPSWGNDSKKLGLSLGYGLATYLTLPECSAQYVVTKTPSCKNVSCVVDFFSDARVIIIIRKGQDVVESFVKSFPSDFGYAARLWAQGAAEVLHLMQNTTLVDSRRVMVVRYEELYQHNKETMQKILDFLGLDAGCFDFEKSSECPVIGSSMYRGSSAKVSWSPVTKGEGFAPLTRSSHWSRFRHYRFNWIAGELATRLGYTLEFHARSPMYLAYNVAASLAEAPRRIFRALRSIIEAGRRR